MEGLWPARTWYVTAGSGFWRSGTPVGKRKWGKRVCVLPGEVRNPICINQFINLALIVFQTNNRWIVVAHTHTHADSDSHKLRNSVYLAKVSKWINFSMLCRAGSAAGRRRASVVVLVVLASGGFRRCNCYCCSSRHSLETRGEREKKHEIRFSF